MIVRVRRGQYGQGGAALIGRRTRLDSGTHTRGVIARQSGGAAMAAAGLRDLDNDVRERLRIRAAANGRSMEAASHGCVAASADTLAPRR